MKVYLFGFKREVLLYQSNTGTNQNTLFQIILCPMHHHVNWYTDHDLWQYFYCRVPEDFYSRNNNRTKIRSVKSFHYGGKR